MPRAIPIATYRLQLTAGFGFAEAAKLVPYLNALGITHLYAAPFLKSRAGSTHGYDVVDHNAVDPELGGEAGLEQLHRALVEFDMGLILDFVPNHMGVHYADNPWWLDVLEFGPRSPFAASFDIDWKGLQGHPRGGVLVPILGRPYGEALQSGEIALRYDAREGSFAAWYYQHKLPIGPSRYSEILQKVVAQAGAGTEPAGRRLLEFAARYRGPHNPPRQQSATFKAELAAIPGAEDIIAHGLHAYDASRDSAALLALHYLLERQHYRVAYWRLALSEINYRRFFDINELAGLRMEDASTFQAVHRLLRRLIAKGCLQGLRIDHMDGLRDPHQYFRRLQHLIDVEKPAGAEPFYVVVEKILGEGERLPRFAGVCGTTGYEWLNVISQLLLDERGLVTLDEVWRYFTGEHRSFHEILIEAKHRVISSILASEFTVLSRLLARIAAGHYSTRDYGADRLRAALELFVLHFPIYRTFITPSGPSTGDREIINRAIMQARADWFGPDAGIFDFLRDALTLDLISSGRTGYSIARARLFAFKVQQFTGPMMAKSLEDTAFYRYHRLLALIEVGSNPAAAGLSVGKFHERMEERSAKSRDGLSATATHDTKRGEDSRARLLALTELADEWSKAVSGWRAQNAPLADSSRLQRIPSSAHEYMIYQSLLGAWPLGGIDASFVERMRAYAIKAAREGKQQTSWVAPDEVYEAGLVSFVERLLNRQSSARFIDSFDALARRAALIGALNSLTQIALKTTMPGVPDFYQGTELWDLSLVDPDNRRPVDFSARADALASVSLQPDWRALAAHWNDGRIKFALLCRLLALRRDLPEVFAKGSYRPLRVEGPHRDEIIAFARIHDRDAVIVVSARWFGRASNKGRAWPSGASWDATVSLEAFRQAIHAVGTPKETHGPRIAIAEAFEHVPVALLRAQYAPARRERTVAKNKQTAAAA
jgi:(1->4)-alpha-D-glucan 1-alpha-D-glucosylmutase